MHVSKLYETVTQAVIRDLETGVPPWVRPWKDDRIKGVGFVPTNLTTGRLYSGGNILLLWMAASVYGWQNLQFCTFHQANAMGAKVRKGERGSSIIFTKHTVEKDEDSGDQKPRTIAKAYTVFNLSQLDSVPDKYLVAQQTAPEGLPEGSSPRVVLARGCGVNVQHGGNKACYIPSRDEVHMPRMSAFTDEDAYWSTLWHEYTHWAGAPKRLDRKTGKRFGDNEYAFEELVAELGSAFLCARLGTPADFRSVSYLDSWLKVLKTDNRAIFSAASYAGQAADWLWNKAFPVQEEKREAA